MQKWSNTSAAPQKISILLFDQFSNLCLANCLEPMRAANTFAGRRVYDWQFCTIDGAVVRSSSDLPVQPDASVNDLRACDMLIVMASYEHLRHDTAQTRRLLRRAAQRARQVVGFDSAAWLLAAAGVLDGYQATLHTDLIEPFSERFHDVDVRHESFVIDRSRITCAGALAAFALMHRLIAMHLGQSIAMDIEALFLAGDRPKDLYATNRDPLVKRAISLMRSTVETPLTMSQFCKQLGTSQRTLTRRCESSLGATPGRMYQHIRLSAAHQMVTGSTLRVSEIALRCGYDDPNALTRAFKARFGASPQALRRRDASGV